MRVFEIVILKSAARNMKILKRRWSLTDDVCIRIFVCDKIARIRKNNKLQF